jgi:transposase
MEGALKKLQQQMEKGRLKDRQKIERRLGKIQARHPQVADLYEIGVNEEEGHLAVQWKLIEERQAWRDAREGAYLLRTNLEADTTEELWTKYIQLTEAEAVFRVLKSELSIRPLFHQIEPRVKAHILVAFLGYAIWVTLKHLLRRNHSDLSPAQALALLSTVQSADIVLPTTDGREIRLRRIATPSPDQQTLLAQLGIVLPERFNLNLECSADSAIA